MNSKQLLKNKARSIADLFADQISRSKRSSDALKPNDPEKSSCQKTLSFKRTKMESLGVCHNQCTYLINVLL